MKRIRNVFAVRSIVKLVIWLILVFVAFSTLHVSLSPLLPTATEYVGKFPEEFWENFGNWATKILPKRIVTFSEHYEYIRVLSILAHLFLLLLVRNIWEVVRKPLKPEKLVENYLIWAVASLLITIIFMTKWISVSNIALVGLGILSLALTIIILLSIYKTRLHEKVTSKNERASEREVKSLSDS